MRSFAALAGYTGSCQGELEAGRFSPTDETLARIASALDLPTDEVMARAGELHPKLRLWLSQEPEAIRGVRVLAGLDSDSLRRLVDGLEVAHVRDRNRQSAPG